MPAKVRARPKIAKRRIFVDRSHFCELALSSQKLVRLDGPKAGLRGLFNPHTGEQFVIDQQDLFSAGSLTR